MSVNILLAKNIVVGIPAHCENGKYLESIADTSVIVYDEIINATDGVSTNMTNATPTNMTNTNLINVMSTMCQYTHDKNARYKMDCYVLHTILHQQI